MHKRGIIRYANYTVCASVFIHFCMQRKNNENIPIKYVLFKQTANWDHSIFIISLNAETFF